METNSLFSGMNVSTSGLTAQRKRMNAIAENLANAETTRTSEGGAYRRQATSLTEDRTFQQQLEATNSHHDKLLREQKGHLQGSHVEFSTGLLSGVKADITQDDSPLREVYDPGHPDADANGIVKMPNVDIIKEMTDLISASRNFEANITAFNATKGMMKKALEL